MVALPVMAQAQMLQYPGFYAGIEGGGSWMFNNTVTTPFGASGQMYPQIGWAAGGMVGYDFVGPRVELEGIYRRNEATVGSGSFNAFGAAKDDIGIMANLLYDFMPAGRSFRTSALAPAWPSFDPALNTSNGTTVFAYQAIVGLGWNVDPKFRVNLDARYYGTTNPYLGGTGYTNNNLSAMLSLQLKFGAPTSSRRRRRRRRLPPPSFMVFFDWDRSNLSQQALNTIRQAADAFKTKGNARITATGHTDTSGPEAYNMALSLRRANAVKDALVRNGVPAHGDHGGRPRREPAAGADRRRCARAAEPPRRDRHPVSHDDLNSRKGGREAAFLWPRCHTPQEMGQAKIGTLTVRCGIAYSAFNGVREFC